MSHLPKKKRNTEKLSVPEKPKIMVVDDEEGVISTFVDFLNAAGFEATGYTDAQEALTVLKHFSPDLILLDIMMPRVDGYEFCRLLKQYPGKENLPVVFVSGKDWEDDAMLTAREGGSLFVSKPVPFDELREVINLALTNEL